KRITDSTGAIRTTGAMRTFYDETKYQIAKYETNNLVYNLVYHIQIDEKHHFHYLIISILENINTKSQIILINAWLPHKSPDKHKHNLSNIMKLIDYKLLNKDIYLLDEHDKPVLASNHLDLGVLLDILKL